MTFCASRGSTKVPLAEGIGFKVSGLGSNLVPCSSKGNVVPISKVHVAFEESGTQTLNPNPKP